MFNGDFKTVLVFYGKVGKIIWCFIFIGTAVYLHLVFTNNFFPNLVKSRGGICNIHERSLRDIRDANELLHQKCTEFHDWGLQILPWQNSTDLTNGGRGLFLYRVVIKLKLVIDLHWFLEKKGG